MQALIHQRDQAWTIQIPELLAVEAGLEDGMAIDLRIVNGHLTLVPIQQTYALDDLLAGITPDNLHGVIDTGEPVGQEIG
jgi:antitoxin MazE